MFREGNYSWQIKKKGGQQGDSLDKGTYHQDYLPKFNLWVPHGRRETTSTGCPVTSMFTHTHTYTKYIVTKSKQRHEIKITRKWKRGKNHLNIFFLGFQWSVGNIQIIFFKDDVGIWSKYVLKVPKVYENSMYNWPGIVGISLANIGNYSNSPWSFTVLASRAIWLVFMLSILKRALAKHIVLLHTGQIRHWWFHWTGKPCVYTKQFSRKYYRDWLVVF